MEFSYVKAPERKSSRGSSNRASFLKNTLQKFNADRERMGTISKNHGSEEPLNVKIGHTYWPDHTHTPQDPYQQDRCYVTDRCYLKGILAQDLERYRTSFAEDLRSQLSAVQETLKQTDVAGLAQRFLDEVNLVRKREEETRLECGQLRSHLNELLRLNAELRQQTWFDEIKKHQQKLEDDAVSLHSSSTKISTCTDEIAELLRSMPDTKALIQAVKEEVKQDVQSGVDEILKYILGDLQPLTGVVKDIHARVIRLERNQTDASSFNAIHDTMTGLHAVLADHIETSGKNVMEMAAKVADISGSLTSESARRFQEKQESRQSDRKSKNEDTSRQVSAKQQIEEIDLEETVKRLTTSDIERQESDLEDKVMANIRRQSQCLSANLENHYDSRRPSKDNSRMPSNEANEPFDFESHGPVMNYTMMQHNPGDGVNQQILSQGPVMNTMMQHNPGDGVNQQILAPVMNTMMQHNPGDGVNQQILAKLEDMSALMLEEVNELEQFVTTDLVEILRRDIACKCSGSCGLAEQNKPEQIETKDSGKEVHDHQHQHQHDHQHQHQQDHQHQHQHQQQAAAEVRKLKITIVTLQRQLDKSKSELQTAQENAKKNSAKPAQTLRELLDIEDRGNLRINFRTGEVQLRREIAFIPKTEKQQPEAVFKEQDVAGIIIRDLFDVWNIFKVPMTIEGHTKGGVDKFWQDLANNRALLVVDTLRSLGAYGDLLTPKGLPGNLGLNKPAVVVQLDIFPDR